ncbi:hypothetical protein RJT34_16677 [Clitoria ternatea]|uniref:D-isomer specific 2-hydroxyacid dehydrogenase NAD-binding domain-containing protein n=1 Tax=Clitoria ternatea TaxID=43366 RepID=A0AAN9J7J5_CLITE
MVKLEPLLVFGPPLIFQVFEAQNFHNYRFLKAFSSPLPLHQFLTTQNVDTSSIQAILCNPHQQVSADTIRLLPSLTDHIDLSECSRCGVQVVTVGGGQFAEDVADMAVGLLINVLWKISAADQHVRNRGPSRSWSFSLGCKELVRCLMEGEIWGAGLDVFENEPNVPKEFTALDNVVLSPHAGSLTLECFTDGCELVARSLEAFFFE